MQQVCEICGAVLHSPANRVEIDGAVMLVCNRCARLGTPVASPPGNRPAPLNPMQAAMRAVSQPSKMEPQYELDPDYHTKVRQAREKLGLSQDELGKQINEKPSVIRHVETKKLQPDPVLTRKLMHFLKLNLLVSSSELERR